MSHSHFHLACPTWVHLFPGLLLPGFLYVPQGQGHQDSCLQNFKFIAWDLSLTFLAHHLKVNSQVLFPKYFTNLPFFVPSVLPRPHLRPPFSPAYPVPAAFCWTFQPVQSYLSHITQYVLKLYFCTVNMTCYPPFNLCHLFISCLITPFLSIPHIPLIGAYQFLVPCQYSNVH